MNCTYNISGPDLCLEQVDVSVIDATLQYCLELFKKLWRSSNLTIEHIQPLFQLISNRFTKRVGRKHLPLPALVPSKCQGVEDTAVTQIQTQLEHSHISTFSSYYLLTNKIAEEMGIYKNTDFFNTKIKHFIR